MTRRDWLEPPTAINVRRVGGTRGLQGLAPTEANVYKLLNEWKRHEKTVLKVKHVEW